MNEEKERATELRIVSPTKGSTKGKEETLVSKGGVQKRNRD